MDVNAMKAGGVNFSFDFESRLDAIHWTVMKDMHERRGEHPTADVLDSVELLSARETEVFALVVSGVLNEQVAATLGIGEKTVKVHRTHVPPPSPVHDTRERLIRG